MHFKGNLKQFPAARGLSAPKDSPARDPVTAWRACRAAWAAAAGWEEGEEEEEEEEVWELPERFLRGWAYKRVPTSWGPTPNPLPDAAESISNSFSKCCRANPKFSFQTLQNRSQTPSPNPAEKTSNSLPQTLQSQPQTSLHILQSQPQILFPKSCRATPKFPQILQSNPKLPCPDTGMGAQQGLGRAPCTCCFWGFPCGSAFNRALNREMCSKNHLALLRGSRDGDGKGWEGDFQGVLHGISVPLHPAPGAPEHPPGLPRMGEELGNLPSSSLLEQLLPGWGWSELSQLWVSSHNLSDKERKGRSRRASCGREKKNPVVLLLSLIRT